MSIAKTQLADVIANKIDATFAECVKLPLVGPDNHPTPYYGIARSDLTGRDAWFPAAVKKGYVAHTRDDVKALALAAAKAIDVDPDHLSVDCAWAKNGHRVSIQPTNGYRRSIGNDRDGVWPRFIIRANYGGKFTGSAGLHRDLCSNLMMMRNVEGVNVSLRHTKSFRDNFDATVASFSSIAARHDNIVEACRELQSTQASVTEYVTRFMPPPSDADGKAKLAGWERRVEKLIARLHDEQRALGLAANSKTADLWLLANMATGYVQHDKSRVGRLNKSERAFAAVDDKLADHAWVVASSMAA